MVLLLAIVVLEWYQQEFAPLRWRIAMAVVIGVTAIVLLQWFRVVPSARRLPAMIGLVLSAGLAAAAGAVTSKDGLFYDVARHVVPAALGWLAATILVVPRESGTVVRQSPDASPMRDMILIGAVVFLAVAVAQYFSYAWFDVDETLYAIQAGRFREFTYVQPVERELLPFFLPPQSLPVPGGFVTQYPPGWPAILAFLSVLGLRPVAGAILAAITVTCVYQIGRQLDSREAGVTGAVLLGTQSTFVNQGASYFSHAASMALLSGAVVFMLRAYRTGTWRPAVGGGLLFGLLIATRPLTGVVLGASAWLWASLVTTSGFRRALTVAMWSTVGGLLPVVMVLAYNNAVTGDALTFGYSALHGSLHSFGFGERGFVGYDASLNPVRTTLLFTPMIATQEYLAMLWHYARGVLPVFLVIPLVAMALARRVAIRGLLLAVFLPLPLLIFFYFGDSERLVIELLPFVFVGLGVLLTRMRREGMLRHGAVAALLASQVAGTFLVLRDRYAVETDGYAGTGFRVMDEVRAYRDRHGPILVFVREPADYSTWFMSLSWYNADKFPGDIIVARDLGADNVRLARRFPGHRPVLAARASGDIPPLTELHLTPDPGRQPR